MEIQNIFGNFVRKLKKRLFSVCLVLKINK